MKRHNHILRRLLSALTLLLILSLTLSLAACGGDDVPPPSGDGNTATPPADSTTGSGDTGNTGGKTDDEGDKKDDTGDEGGSGIPKQDTDPDGKNYGELEKF